MQLKSLLERVEYTSSGNMDISIEDIVYDSRKVRPGVVFVCLEGASVDGHMYAAAAAQAGAAAVVAARPVETGDTPLILVKDTRAALAQMSAAFFHYPAEEIPVVGITGTKGKTTSAYMICSILEAAGIKTGMIGTVGIRIGETVTATDNTTPESYIVQRALRNMVDAGCGAVVMEASSIGLRGHRADAIPFAVGLFTNFSEDHIGGAEHKDMEEYLNCKRMLFQKCRLGVFNRDDPMWMEIQKGKTCEVSYFGFSKEADLRASKEALISRPGFLGVRFHAEGTMEFDAEVPIPGKFSVYNALGAAAVCGLMGISSENIVKGLAAVKVKGRVEPVPVPGNYTLLIDYAHNAVSMESILTTLREYNPHRLICLFGAGGNRSRTRRFEMGEVSGRLADLSVLTADNSRFEDVMDIIADIKVGIGRTNGKYVVIPDRKEAIQYCMQNAEDGDIVVLAGKGHEDYQEIRGVKYHLDEREVVADILAGRF